MYIHVHVHAYIIHIHTYIHAYIHECIHRFEKVGDADMALFGWEDSHHDTSFAIP